MDGQTHALPGDAQMGPACGLHEILVCLSCRAADSNARPGRNLLAALRRALQDDPALAETFAVSGGPCMAGCARPCTVAMRASGKATWLFGDLNADFDVADMVAFARQYIVLEDGWCRSAERPGKLAHSTLARIPAAKTLARDGAWL